MLGKGTKERWVKFLILGQINIWMLLNVIPMAQFVLSFPESKFRMIWSSCWLQIYSKNSCLYQSYASFKGKKRNQDSNSLQKIGGWGTSWTSFGVVVVGQRALVASILILSLPTVVLEICPDPLNLRSTEWLHLRNNIYRVAHSIQVKKML